MAVKQSQGLRKSNQTPLRILTQRRGWLEFQAKSCKGNYLQAIRKLIEALPEDTLHKKHLEERYQIIESTLTSMTTNISDFVESAAGYLQNFHPDYEPVNCKRKAKKGK